MGGKLEGAARLMLKEALEVVGGVKEWLKDCCSYVEAAGSVRRGCPIVGDVDVVVVPDNEKLFTEKLTLRWGMQKSGKKPKRSGLWAVNGKLVQVDLFVSDKYGLGAMLMFATGCWQLNVYQRQVVKNAGRNWKLNEKGLWRGGMRATNSVTERGIYKRLGMKYLEPEERSVEVVRRLRRR